MKTINITCENTQQDYEVELGTTLREVKKTYFLKIIITYWEHWLTISCRTCNM